ncbi:hypothetical protein VZT92_009694 [Zoarces viviparus]|uniref:Prolactin receptor n=1 Tax=Zoarces viviparus TaxID=48416 RepID=A0AAW1FDX3_ZOAVI
MHHRRALHPDALPIGKKPNFEHLSAAPFADKKSDKKKCLSWVPVTLQPRLRGESRVLAIHGSEYTKSSTYKHSFCQQDLIIVTQEKC